MARTRPPTRLIAPTPGTVSSRSLICLRAISVTSRKSRLPETAMVITGIDPVSNLSTIGARVPSGKSDRIELTLSRTSWVPTSPFFDSRNWTVTIDTPSWVIDRSSSMPETVLMMSSTGLLTVVSISSTLAPGSTVVTVHTGKSTLGKRSTPSSLYETSPSTTGIATSTQVNTGRLMQRSEIVMGIPGLGKLSVVSGQFVVCVESSMTHRFIHRPTNLPSAICDLSLAICHSPRVYRLADSVALEPNSGAAVGAVSVFLWWSDGGFGVRITTGVPSASWVWPVMTTIAEVGRLLLVTSTQPGPSLPVTMSLTDRALPFSTKNSLVTPAKRMIDSVGATAAWADKSVTIVALAKPPALSRRLSLGTWVST